MERKNRFKGLLSKSDIKLSELSLKTGINRSTLNNYLRGESIPKNEKAQILADFFGVEIGYLLGNQQWKKSGHLPKISVTLPEQKVLDNMRQIQNQKIIDLLIKTSDDLAELDKGISIMNNYIETAHQLASNAHAGQTDKAGVDYIKHPETVASFVNSDDEKATAYLHDTLEDTSLTAQDLRAAGIPENVIQAVKLLTHDKSEPYFDYLKRVKLNPIAKAVKLADLKHNSDRSRLKTITTADEERLLKYAKAIEFLNS